MPPGAVKPREFSGIRYGLCEDMAQMLTEQDVLERTSRGLVQDALAFTPAEAGWIVRRLSELLG
jgi:hypothetical protein